MATHLIQESGFLPQNVLYSNINSVGNNQIINSLIYLLLLLLLLLVFPGFPKCQGPEWSGIEIQGEIEGEIEGNILYHIYRDGGDASNVNDDEMP